MKKLVLVTAVLAVLGSAAAIAKGPKKAAPPKGPTDKLSCGIHGGNAAPTACGGW